LRSTSVPPPFKSSRKLAFFLVYRFKLSTNTFSGPTGGFSLVGSACRENALSQSTGLFIRPFRRHWSPALFFYRWRLLSLSDPSRIFFLSLRAPTTKCPSSVKVRLLSSSACGTRGPGDLLSCTFLSLIPRTGVDASLSWTDTPGCTFLLGLRLTCLDLVRPGDQPAFFLLEPNGRRG